MGSARSRSLARAIVAGSVVVRRGPAGLAAGYGRRLCPTWTCLLGARLDTSHRIRPTPRAYARNGHPQVLTQSLARILLAEQAPALQFRHDEADKILVGARHVRGGNHKAVAGALREPLFELIRHFLRAADDRVMHAAAPAEMDKVAPSDSSCRSPARRGRGSPAGQTFP